MLLSFIIVNSFIDCVIITLMPIVDLIWLTELQSEEHANQMSSNNANSMKMKQEKKKKKKRKNNNNNNVIIILQ